MISIYLRKVNGKGERLQLQSTKTLAYLHSQVSRALEASNELSLYFKGCQLPNDQLKTIEGAGLSANSIVHVLEKIPTNVLLIQFSLILQGRSLHYEFSAQASAGQLKRYICQSLQFREDQLTLSYLGAELEDTRSLSSYSFPESVLLSGSLEPIAATAFRRTWAQNTESCSQSEGADSRLKQVPSSLEVQTNKRLKKTQSLTIQNAENLPFHFCSVKLNKIQQKNDESRNDSQINESQEILEELDQEVRARMTLQTLSKPWYGDQCIIETESIVGDDEDESLMGDCSLELIRSDKMRRYLIECTTQDSFEDAQAVVARLQRVPSHLVKFLITFDDVGRSGMSLGSGKGYPKSPRSNESIKKRKSCDIGRLSVGSLLRQGMKMKVIQKAVRMKTRVLSFEFQILKNA